MCSAEQYSRYKRKKAAPFGTAPFLCFSSLKTRYPSQEIRKGLPVDSAIGFDLPVKGGRSPLAGHIDGFPVETVDTESLPCKCFFCGELGWGSVFHTHIIAHDGQMSNYFYLIFNREMNQGN